MKVSLIWAMTRNRVIGRGNRLPWHLRADSRFFRETTLGKPVIMGRRTFESLDRPLAGRTNIVLSRGNFRHDFHQDGVQAVDDLDSALAAAERQCRIDGVSECFVAGGAAVYASALAKADRLYMTLIDVELEGDTFFPEVDLAQWREIENSSHAADENNDYSFKTTLYERLTACVAPR
jgi:dihydrofolate reductase